MLANDDDAEQETNMLSDDLADEKESVPVTNDAQKEGR